MRGIQMQLDVPAQTKHWTWTVYEASNLKLQILHNAATIPEHQSKPVSSCGHGDHLPTRSKHALRHVHVNTYQQYENSNEFKQSCAQHYGYHWKSICGRHRSHHSSGACLNVEGQ